MSQFVYTFDLQGGIWLGNGDVQATGNVSSLYLNLTNDANIAGNVTCNNANVLNTLTTNILIANNLFVNGATFTVPVGNTAQAPAAANGLLYFNTDSGALQYGSTGNWVIVPNLGEEGAI